MMQPSSHTQYRRFHRVIHWTIHQFQKRYGGDYEELLSESHELFMEAFATYDPNKSQFHTWLIFRLWNGLIDNMRKSSVELEYLMELYELRKGKLCSNFNLKHLLLEMSSDAVTVVKLITDFPPMLEKSCADKNGKLRQDRARKGLRKTLYQMGWVKERIESVFHEIKGALR